MVSDIRLGIGSKNVIHQQTHIYNCVCNEWLTKTTFLYRYSEVQLWLVLS